MPPSMLSPSDIQQLHRYATALAGGAEAGYELLYDGMKELFRHHPRGLKEPNPYAFRFLREFAEKSGRLARSAPESPDDAPETPSLDDERVARIEGLLAGLVSSG